MGPVKFGPSGEWVKARALMVQYKGLKEGKAVDAYALPGARQILYPENLATGTWMTYEDGKKAGM